MMLPRKTASNSPHGTQEGVNRREALKYGAVGVGGTLAAAVALVRDSSSVNAAGVDSPVVMTVTADGTDDQTARLNEAFRATTAEGAPAVLALRGDFFISNDLEMPHGSKLIGYGARLICRGFENGREQALRVRGSSSSWTTTVEGLDLIGVRLVFGESELDFANGVTVRNCSISHVATGITFRYNCWVTRVENCRIHTCWTGIKNDFRAVEQNSGAAMVVSGSVVFNCGGPAFWQDGSSKDGWHVSFVGTDLEHCETSVRLTDVGDGLLDIVGGHFELNRTSYIEADSGSIRITSLWMFELDPVSTTRIAHFVLGGSSDCHVASGRVAWAPTTSPLFRLTGACRLVIDPEAVSAPLIGLVGADHPYPANPSSPSGTRGVLFPTGQWRPATFERTIAVGTEAVSLFYLPAFDVNSYMLQFALRITAVSDNNLLRLYVNPGGQTNTDLTLPSAVGTSIVTLRISSGLLLVDLRHDNGGSSGRVDIDHPISTDRYIDVQSLGNTTLFAEGLTAQVIRGDTGGPH
ncbi:hypothetical protein [Geodermatophilus sp. SYSU D00700]